MSPTILIERFAITKWKITIGTGRNLANKMLQITGPNLNRRKGLNILPRVIKKDQFHVLKNKKLPAVKRLNDHNPSPVANFLQSKTLLTNQTNVNETLSIIL